MNRATSVEFLACLDEALDYCVIRCALRLDLDPQAPVMQALRKAIDDLPAVDRQREAAIRQAIMSKTRKRAQLRVIQGTKGVVE